MLYLSDAMSEALKLLLDKELTSVFYIITDGNQ